MNHTLTFKITSDPERPLTEKDLESSARDIANFLKFSFSQVRKVDHSVSFALFDS